MQVLPPVIRQIVAAVRSGLARQAEESGKPPSEAFTPEGLAGWCELAEAMAYHRLSSEGVESKQLHSNQVAELLGGWRHAFLVVTTADQGNYLVDPTFGQFFSPGSLGTPGRRLQSTPAGQAMARDLLDQGAIEFTPQAAALYETAFSGQDATSEFYSKALASQRPMHYSPVIFASLMK